MARKHEFTWRLGLVYAGVLAVAALVVVQALRVQVWQGEEWRGRGRSVSVKDFEVMPNRGNIRAEDGRLLASSVPYYELRFDCASMPDSVFDKGVDSLALCLSRFFGDKSAAGYRRMLVEGRNRVVVKDGKRVAKPNRYLLLNRRRVSYTELMEVKRFPIFREKGTTSGLIAEQENARIQPHEDLAFRTVGYLNEGEDGRREGRVGLEGAYEGDLRGVPGRSFRQMMSGRWVSVTMEEPVDGNDVVTTINVDYQDVMQTALERQLRNFGAASGTAILMEVATGDVKAITNLTRRGDGYEEVLNHAVGTAAEPGSVFKAAVVMALMEDGLVEPTDTVDLGNGRYTYYGRTLKESSERMRGRVTVKDMFACSSNGFSKIVTEKYGDDPQRFIDRLCSFGLNRPLGVEIAGEGMPLIKSPKGADGKPSKDWSGLTLPWMSIGYEVKLTPLQILTFYNGIANDGREMKPRFVKEIRDGERVVRRVETEVLNGHLCSRRTIRALHEMMEAVVDSGTAMNLRGTVCRIAGKTGTALVAVPGEGYKGRLYRASFVGYFPAEEPLYSCIVSVDGVRGYGNVVAGNVFKEVVNQVYSRLSLEMADAGRDTLVEALPVSMNGWREDLETVYEELGMAVDESAAGDAEWVVTARGEEDIAMKPRTVREALVPNVGGMGLRDAVYLLENSGLKVGVKGAGTVRKQSIGPGTRVRRGSYILIELR